MVSLNFDGVDPTRFNFGSDLLALGFRTLFGLVIGQVFTHLMSKHVSSGRSIPAKALGNVPADFFASSHLAYLLKWSGPAILFAFLLAIADFSHSLADLGLSFPTINMEGPEDTVLTLEANRRNSQRLFELSGDPAGSRSTPRLASTLDALFVEQDSGVSDYSAARREQQLVDAYLAAVIDVASGGSPFVSYNSIERLDRVYARVEGTLLYADDMPLVRIAKQLPVTCSSNQLESIMQRLLGASPDTLRSKDSIAFVPNCTYNNLRSTGIYDTDENKVEQPAEIHELFLDYNNERLFLERNGALVQSITLTSNEKALARDRPDWKQGRLVSNITAIHYGDAIFQLDNTALAALQESWPEFVQIGTAFEYRRRSSYILVSNVKGGCPTSPKGKSESSECMIFSRFICEGVFLEDFEQYKPSDFIDPSKAAGFASILPKSEEIKCDLNTIYIVWGRNFVADAELVATVAGVITEASLQPEKASELRRFLTNVIPAALFALASVDSLPSVNTYVTPSINGIYIVFMLLPVVLATVLAFTTRKHPAIPIPTDFWDMMVLGRETKAVPKRKEGEMKFPKEAVEIFEFTMLHDPESSRQRPGVQKIGLLGEPIEEGFGIKEEEEEPPETPEMFPEPVNDEKEHVCTGLSHIKLKHNSPGACDPPSANRINI